MSELNEFLKLIAEGKKTDPKAVKAAEKTAEIKEHIKFDLGELFGEIAVLKAQKQELVEEYPDLDLIESDPILVVEPKPDEVVEDAITAASKYLTDKTFQQPIPDKTAADFRAITDKIKYLEQWVGKISATGPGGGEVNLRWLDDINRSSIGAGKYLTYNETTKKFEFVTISGDGTPQIQSDWTQTNDQSVDYIKNKPTIIEPVNADWNSTSGLSEILHKPTIPAAQIQSDWNQATTTALDYIKNKPTIPDIGPIEDLFAATKEPMGHQDRTESTISFNNTSRRFTIAPVSTEFNVWVKGTKQTYTTAQTVDLPNTSGLYYIYFNDAGIGYQTTYFTWDQQAMTAYVYYNAAVGVGYVFDERHGITLDWQTHEYLHRTHGALYSSGFDVSNYTLMGDGSSNTHCTLDLAGGTFFDEDNQIDIVHSNTPTANTFQQDLVGPAQIPVFYKNSTGAWVLDAATNYPMKLGTDRPRYNYNNGGSWTTADIDNNKFGVTFIVATNMINTPVIGILGQSARDNVGSAEAYNLSELDLTGFPITEMRQLYRVVYECKTSYTNTPSARITSIWDLRVTTTASTNVTTGDHGSLTGLADDDHPQYLLRTDAASTYATPSYVNTAITNIVGAAPAALDTLKEIADQLASDESVVSSLTTTVAGKVSLTGSYANPSWITSLAYSKLTGAPTNVSTFTNDSGYLTTAAAGSLTGTTLNSTVVASSLTSVGTLTSLTVSGTINANGGTVDTTQTTANLFTATPTINIGTAAGCTAVNIGYIGNTTVNNLLKVNYTGSGSVSSVWISGYNSRSSTGYHDFLQATNNYSSATNPNKHFRLTPTGTLELLNNSYSSTLLSIADNGIVTIPNTASVTSNGATDNALAIGTKGQLFDDGNLHIHTSSGALWINSLDGGDIRLGTQTNSNKSSVIADATSVGHSFFCKVQSGFNVNEPSVSMDNLNVRLRWTGTGSNLISEASAVSGSFSAYVTIVDNVAGQALRGDTNANGITFSSGTWTSINANFTISSGGDMLIYHVVDNTNSRIYRVTAIHCAGTKGGYLSIERMC